MRDNLESNWLIDEAIPSKSYSVGDTEGASVDHSLYPTAAYFISAGTIGSSGTINMKLQYHNGSAWVDDDGSTGNDAAITQITAAGDAVLHVVKPRGRYSRVFAAVGTATCVYGVTMIAGPKRHVAAA